MSSGLSSHVCRGEEKKKKTLAFIRLGAGVDSAAPDLGGDPAGADLEDDIESCGGTRVGGRVSDEEEEDEEEVPPLVRKNRRSKTNNDVPIQALSGLVNL